MHFYRALPEWSLLTKDSAYVRPVDLQDQLPKDDIRHAQLVGVLRIVEPGDQLGVEQIHFFKATTWTMRCLKNGPPSHNNWRRAEIPDRYATGRVQPMIWPSRTVICALPWPEFDAIKLFRRAAISVLMAALNRATFSIESSFLPHICLGHLSLS